MDASQSDVEVAGHAISGFPDIYFFKRNGKSKPIKYEVSIYFIIKKRYENCFLFLYVLSFFPMELFFIMSTEIFNLFSQGGRDLDSFMDFLTEHAHLPVVHDEL